MAFWDDWRRHLELWKENRFLFSLLIQDSVLYRRYAASADWVEDRFSRLRTLLNRQLTSARVPSPFRRPILTSVAILLASGLLEGMGRFLGPLLLFLSPWNPSSALKSQVYPIDWGTLLPITGSISGVLLALYMTTLGVVLSTVYAGVSRDLRRIALRETTGSYLGAVAGLAALSLLLLVAEQFGFVPGALNLLFIASLGVWVVVGFLFTGPSLLSLFDPSQLTESITEEIRGAFPEPDGGITTPAGPRTQALRETAEDGLDRCAGLLAMARSGEFAHEDIETDLGSSLAELTRIYQDYKWRVPTNSEWFRETTRHRTWLESGPYEGRWALARGAQLDPEQVPETHWVENGLHHLTGESIGGLIRKGRWSSAIELATECQDLAHGWANVADVAAALDLASTVGDDILASLLQGVDDGVNEKPRVRGVEPARRLELAELGPKLYIQVLTGWMAWQASLGSNTLSLAQAIGEIHPPGLHEQPAPRELLSRMPVHLDQAAYEQGVEGSAVTPGWYWKEFVAADTADILLDEATDILGQMETRLPTLIETYADGGMEMEATVCAQRALELCKAYLEALDRLESNVERLWRDHAKGWASWDIEDPVGLYDRAEALRKSVLVEFADLAGDLTGELELGRDPDFAGQSFQLLATECYGALESGDEDFFHQIFPRFFSGAIRALEQAFRQTRKYYGGVAFALRQTPIKVLNDVSGCAVTLGELQDRPYKDIVVRVWKHYLDRFSAPSAGAVEAIVNLQFGRTMPVLTVGDEIHTELTRRLREALIRHDQLIQTPTLLGGDPRSDIPGPFVELLGRNDFAVKDVGDLFCLAVSLAYAGDADDPVPNHKQALRRQLEEAEDRHGTSIYETGGSQDAT